MSYSTFHFLVLSYELKMPTAFLQRQMSGSYTPVGQVEEFLSVLQEACGVAVCKTCSA